MTKFNELNLIVFQALFRASGAQVNLNSPVELIRWNEDHFQVFYNSSECETLLKPI